MILSKYPDHLPLFPPPLPYLYIIEEHQYIYKDNLETIK